MKTYQFVEVGLQDGDLYLTCTHKLDFTNLIGFIEKSVPSAQTSEYQYMSGFIVTQLKDDNHRVLWLTMTWLCNNSFEPFMAYPSNMNNVDKTYCFRREIIKP